MGDREADRRALVIVDGYNVLFRLAPWVMEQERGGLGAARQKLEEVLRRHAERRGLAVWVVYDGRSTGGSHPGELDEGRFRVTYVDPPAEADDHIVQMAMQAARRRTPARVVTSDLRLAVRLHESTAEVIPVEDFVRDLPGVAPRPARRSGDLSPEAREDLARHFEALPGWDRAERLVENRAPRDPQGGAPGASGERGLSPGGDAPGETGGDRAAGQESPEPSRDHEATRERRRLRGARRQERRLSARRQGKDPGRGRRR